MVLCYEVTLITQGNKILFLTLNSYFQYHRIFMVLTWLLTVVGFILILVEVGGWSTTGDNPHAITGIVTVILCFIQPIGKCLHTYFNIIFTS